MHASLVALGLKIGDFPMWQRFFQSKIGLVLASVTLGLIGTLGFAPYQLWVVTLVTLGFEFFYVGTLKTKKQVFWSLWLYFTAINAATLSWLNFVMNGFGQMPLVLSWLLEILLSAYLAFFHALLGCLAFKLAHRRLKAAKQALQTNDAAEDDDEYDADEEYLDDDEHDQTVANSKKAQSQLSSQPSDNSSLQKEQSADTAAVQQEKSEKEKNEQPESTPAPLGPLHFYKNAFFLAFLPVALILADYISGWMFTGFPWMYIGYTALEGPFSAYAPLLGVRGITLVLFICAGALALTLERRYVYLPVAGVLFAIGIFCQGLNFTKDLPDIKITGIQGNILQQIKWDPRQVMPIIGHYVNQTMPYFGKSDLIIWPESALPVFAQEIGNILQDLNTTAYSQQTPLLSGLQHVDFVKRGHVETFNSIYLLGTSPNLADVQIYKKRQLVPFGEQVPFEKYTRQLGSIFNFPMSGFTAGAREQSQLKLYLTSTHATSAQPVSKTQPSQSQPQTGDSSQAGSTTPTLASHSETAATDRTANTTNFANDVNTVNVANQETEQVEDTANSSDSSALSTTYNSNNLGTSQSSSLNEQNLGAQSNSEERAETSVEEEEEEVQGGAAALTQAGDEDVFIDERAYHNFAEDTVNPEQPDQIAASAEPRDDMVYAESAQATDHDYFAKVGSDSASSTAHLEYQELMEGENEWFESEIPAFPTEVAVPLEQPLELSFIPAICYESIFPELMTSLHDENTNGIIMISNDSWFGTTRGPDEHLGIARMRSMEMQKPMIRITNSGHTVLIDRSGKVIESLPQDKSAIMHTDFTPNSGMTPYVRFNNIPLYVILLLLCGLGWYLRSRELNALQQNLEALVRP